jgi:hypothetical protein
MVGWKLLLWSLEILRIDLIKHYIFAKRCHFSVRIFSHSDLEFGEQLNYIL